MENTPFIFLPIVLGDLLKEFGFKVKNLPFLAASSSVLAGFIFFVVPAAIALCPAQGFVPVPEMQCKYQYDDDYKNDP